MTAVFESDLKRSRRINLQAWKARPVTEQAIEQLSSLLGQQL